MVKQGTSCFDLDEERGVLATGSSDTKIRMWSATADAKPWMTLAGHPATVSAVSLQQQSNFLFSLCERSVKPINRPFKPSAGDKTEMAPANYGNWGFVSDRPVSLVQAAITLIDCRL